jgi:hypothetical protein
VAPTGLFWMATSERERQRALELARALQQKESRDELGVGSVRDALANLLFPGTSTLHTRARYHLFVPWAYQAALARRGSGMPLAARVREEEARLIGALKDQGETRGLIGRDAGAAVKRMPSTLYWQGLHVWGIRRAGGPQRTVERMLSGQRAPVLRDEDGEPLDHGGTTVWHPNLPDPADDDREPTFRLTGQEADFLGERLYTEPGTRGTALAQLAGLEADHEDVAFVWEHPALGRLEPATRYAIEQGRRFSLLMHGAAWLYNVVLSEASGRPDREVHHRARFAEWADHVVDDIDVLTGWDLEELWAVAGSRAPAPTRGFVRGWRELLDRDGPHELVDRADARTLVTARERAMKGRNARTVNSKALHQWGGDSGTLALDYRWTTARGLIADIRLGLEGADAAD